MSNLPETPNFSRHLRLPVLVLLAFVAAFAASARAAADAPAGALSFRLTVPGLAADVTSAPSAGAVTVQHVSTTLDGGLWVYGEVHNGLDHAIANVALQATATNAAGATLGTANSHARVNEIAAGANGPFRVLLPMVNDPAAQASVTVTGYDAEAVPPPATTVSLAGPKPLVTTTVNPDTKKTIATVSDTTLVLDGRVTNNSGASLSSIEIVVAMYDGNGAVVQLFLGVDLSVMHQPDGEAPVLHPGETGQFTVAIPKPLYLQTQGVSFAGFVNATAGP